MSDKINLKYNRILAKRINELRSQRGDLSVNSLATMSGVDQSTLDHIVQGVTKNPKVQTIHKIALGFNMTLAEFLDFPELNEFEFDQEDSDE